MRFADHRVKSVHECFHLVPPPVFDLELEIAQGRFPGSGEEAADGRHDHRSDAPGEDQDRPDKEDADEDQKLEELPPRGRDLLAFEGEGKRQEKRGGDGVIRNGQRPEGKRAQAARLGIIGVVGELNLIMDLAVEELGQKAVVEQLPAAGRGQSSVPVKIDVIGDG